MPFALATAARLSLALAVVLSTAVPTAADIVGFERLALADLGFTTRNVLPALAAPIAEFSLPPDAGQGPHSWLTGQLHFSIRFAPESRGLAYVSADTNGATMAQIKFEMTPGRDLRYSAVALPEGRRETAVSGRSAEVRFTNYLRNAGVRPGRNTFSLSVELEEAIQIEQLVLHDDSAIERTEISPYPLSIVLGRAAKRTIRAGERFTVPFLVQTKGAATAEDVVVSVVPSAPLDVVGAHEQPLGSVGREPRKGSFTFRADRPGEYRIELRARSSLNRPVRTVGVRVLPVSSGPRFLPALMSGAAVAAGVAMMLMLRLNKRAKAT